MNGRSLRESGADSCKRRQAVIAGLLRAAERRAVAVGVANLVVDVGGCSGSVARHVQHRLQLRRQRLQLCRRGLQLLRPARCGKREHGAPEFGKLRTRLARLVVFDDCYILIEEDVWVLTISGML